MQKSLLFKYKQRKLYNFFATGCKSTQVVKNNLNVDVICQELTCCHRPFGRKAYNFDSSALRQSIFSTMTYFHFSDRELRKIASLKFITICLVSFCRPLAKDRNFINLKLSLSRCNIPSFNLTFSQTVSWRLCLPILSRCSRNTWPWRFSMSMLSFVHNNSLPTMTSSRWVANKIRSPAGRCKWNIDKKSKNKNTNKLVM